MDKTTLLLLRHSYIYILRSRDSQRIHNQSLLIELRDTIAMVSGWSLQQTQEYHEWVAFEIPDVGRIRDFYLKDKLDD